MKNLSLRDLKLSVTSNNQFSIMNDILENVIITVRLGFSLTLLKLDLLIYQFFGS